MWLSITTALAFDPTHAGLQAVLDARVRGDGVDYAGLRAEPAPLDAYLRSLATASLDGRPRAEVVAFWINAYNALTIDVVADAWPLASIRDLDGGKVWDTRRFPVAGQSVTLNHIEHAILRPLGDARVHGALNCASRGCPPLAGEAYVGARLDAQLDAAARRLAAPATLSGGRLVVSRIFEWFGGDFVLGYGAARRDLPGLDGAAEAAANFVAAHRPDLAGPLGAGGYTVTFAEYDWAVNAAP